MYVNIAIGYIYVAFSLLLKPLFLGIFVFCYGGMSWYNADDAEEK